MSRGHQVWVWVAVAVTLGVAVLTRPLWTVRLADDMEVVRVGVLPSDGEAALQQHYAPLLAHLTQETGWRYDLVPAQSYEHLLHLFKDGEVDLAAFGGLTFIRAHAFYGAEPLVMRESDLRATTYAVVKEGGPFEHCINLACPDLAAAKLMFGPLLSTSGHLMPRHFLKAERGVTPEGFFRDVQMSAGHRATALAIRDGAADIGMIYSAVFKTMAREGQFTPGALHVIWETPPYPDAVWAVPARMDENQKTRLRDAFLALDMSNPVQARILAAQRTSSYLPAAMTDFMPLMEIAETQGLMTREQP